MAAQDNLGGQFRPITDKELPLNLPTARGSSAAVSHEDFQASASRGANLLGKYRSQKHETPGMEGAGWEGVKNHAFEATREPWGGATYNARTGSPVNFHEPDKFAVTVREPHEEPISVEPHAGHERFSAAMDQARTQYGDRLASSHHYLGVFHDADSGRVDIDPVVVTGDSRGKHNMQRGLTDAKDISSATHAVGGAYHFNSGDGFWPDHVKSDEQFGK